jgi:hypothetical protein
MAKAKKKVVRKKVARKKVRSPSEMLVLKLMNESKNINQQIHEFGSAVAMDCHNLDTTIWAVAEHFKFGQSHRGCYHADYI